MSSSKKKAARKAAELEAQQAQKKQKTLPLLKRPKVRFFLIIFAVSAVLALLIVPRLIININQMLVETEMTINEVDTLLIDDGTYYSSFENASMQATVAVTVESGYMTDIEITSYYGIDPDNFDDVISDVLMYQMLNTPNDPERTYSDRVLLKAIEAALTSLNTTPIE